MARAGFKLSINTGSVSICTDLLSLSREELLEELRLRSTLLPTLKGGNLFMALGERDLEGDDLLLTES